MKKMISFSQFQNWAEENKIEFDVGMRHRFKTPEWHLIPFVKNKKGDYIDGLSGKFEKKPEESLEELFFRAKKQIEEAIHDANHCHNCNCKL